MGRVGLWSVCPRGRIAQLRRYAGASRGRALHPPPLAEGVHDTQAEPVAGRRVPGRHSGTPGILDLEPHAAAPMLHAYDHAAVRVRAAVQPAVGDQFGQHELGALERHGLRRSPSASVRNLRAACGAPTSSGKRCWSVAPSPEASASGQARSCTRRRSIAARNSPFSAFSACAPPRSVAMILCIVSINAACRRQIACIRASSAGAASCLGGGASRALPAPSSLTSIGSPSSERSREPAHAAGRAGEVPGDGGRHASSAEIEAQIDQLLAVSGWVDDEDTSGLRQMQWGGRSSPGPPRRTSPSAQSSSAARSLSARGAVRPADTDLRGRAPRGQTALLGGVTLRPQGAGLARHPPRGTSGCRASRRETPTVRRRPPRPS